MRYGSPEHKAHLKSKQWRWLVEERKQKTGRKCEACGYRRYLQGHHVHYLTLGNERLNDIRIVCRACHWRITQLHRQGWSISRSTAYVIRAGRRRQRWWKFKRWVRRSLIR